MSELYDILTETPPTKVVLLALDQGLWDCERSLAELAALCEANHMEAVAQISQKRQTPETGIVLGSGKLEEASLAAQELGVECAVFDGELTGSQIRNISTALGGLEVIDRTMLILEIFRSRAVTNEGKLQTELALLRYRLPRLQGMGEALSRQGGGGGGGGGARRGAGETKLELDRRHVHARIDALAEKLAEMEKRRGESRKARAKTGMPVVSLVGYTNVGKSSLMNALCGPSVAEADMLFATLDPTSRKLVLPSGMAVLLVDTVGFVSRLPHNLVEAFKSTLEEAAWSDVIIRVADAGDEQREEQLAVTDEVLDGLDCTDIPRLTVYNKCDKPNTLSFDPDILLTSAKTGYGLDTLLQKLDEMYGDLPEDTAKWALEYQLWARMLLAEGAVMLNPKHLDLFDCTYEFKTLAFGNKMLKDSGDGIAWAKAVKTPISVISEAWENDMSESGDEAFTCIVTG